MASREAEDIEVTDRLTGYSKLKVPTFGTLSEYVFKSRSPSCGLNSTPVLIYGKCINENNRGVFALEFTKHFPYIQVIEESRIGLSRKVPFNRVVIIVVLLLQFTNDDAVVDGLGFDIL
jgi:uncharacterized protein YbbK (DUF523 family)